VYKEKKKKNVKEGPGFFSSQKKEGRERRWTTDRLDLSKTPSRVGQERKKSRTPAKNSVGEFNKRKGEGRGEKGKKKFLCLRPEFIPFIGRQGGGGGKSRLKKKVKRVF